MRTACLITLHHYKLHIFSFNTSRSSGPASSSQIGTEWQVTCDGFGWRHARKSNGEAGYIHRSSSSSIFTKKNGRKRIFFNKGSQVLRSKLCGMGVWSDCRRTAYNNPEHAGTMPSPPNRQNHSVKSWVAYQ